MISIVNGVLVRILNQSGWCVEVKPICPKCGNAEASSWNYEACFAPEPNNYGYKKTKNHTCSSCRQTFQIELYNN